jgi:hypothetical protein
VVDGAAVNKFPRPDDARGGVRQRLVASRPHAHALDGSSRVARRLFAATVWVIVLISTREATPADMSTAEWLRTRRGNDNSSDDEERAA